jgi:hypothetical protein
MHKLTTIWSHHLWISYFLALRRELHFYNAELKILVVSQEKRNSIFCKWEMLLRVCIHILSYSDVNFCSTNIYFTIVKYMRRESIHKTVNCFHIYVYVGKQSQSRPFYFNTWIIFYTLSRTWRTNLGARDMLVT